MSGADLFLCSARAISAAALRRFAARWSLSSRAVAMITLCTLPQLTMAAPPVLDAPDAVPLLQLSPVAIRNLELPQKDTALRFAAGTSLTANVRSGSWDEPESGRARWRLRVNSQGARSLSFEFRRLVLPTGAELWFYDRHGREVQGPVVAANAGSTWSPLVRSDEVLIEANMPSAQRDRFVIEIAQAFHGFTDVAGRSWPLDPASDTGNGASGACNIDVACSAGDAWQPQSRATVLLTIGGTTLCSGTLVNNVQQDDRPLVLTANHCGINHLNVTSTIAYFNVQRGACGSGSWGSLLQNLRGKTLLTSSRAGSDADFALIELASKPPSTFNAYYSGFDASGAVPTSGVGVHHPRGDDKKISRLATPASTASNVCIGSNCNALLTDGFRIDAWAVNWSKGATEPGSSGSALWDQDGDVVGVLSGGRSECATSTSNNGGTDYYSRLDTAWAQPGADLLFPQSIKNVLDPDNSGCTRVAGKNPGPATPVHCASSTPTPVPDVSDPTDASGGGGESGGGGGGGGAGLLMVPLLLAGLLRRQRGRQHPVRIPVRHLVRWN